MALLGFKQMLRHRIQELICNDIRLVLGRDQGIDLLHQKAKIPERRQVAAVPGQARCKGAIKK
jgi:hypothetical protein